MNDTYVWCIPAEGGRAPDVRQESAREKGRSCEKHSCTRRSVWTQVAQQLGQARAQAPVSASAATFSVNFEPKG